MAKNIWLSCFSPGCSLTLFASRAFPSDLLTQTPGNRFHLPFSPPPAGPAWAGGRHLAASFHSQGVSLLCCLRFPRSSLPCWWVHTPGRAQEPVPEAARDPEAGREVPWGWRGAQ